MRVLSDAPSTEREAVVALAGSTVGRDVNVHLYTESARRAVEHWRVRRALRALDQRYEEQVAAWFVKPKGWDRANSILQQRRIVLVTAASGSGRRTAAVRLLSTDDRGGGPIHELPVHQEGLDERVLDRDDVMENDRLLLDLSSAGDDIFDTVSSKLAGFWGTARERHAVLVVVLPEQNVRDLDSEFADLLVPLGRPDGTSVFEGHLTSYGIEPVRHELRRSGLVQVVDHGSMQDIAHLALLVRQAQDRSRRETGFAALLDQALAAHADRADDAAAQVAGQSGRGRALMLASALLEGSFADTVFEADRLLVRLLNLHEEQNHEFEQPDLRSRLGEIGVDIGRDGRVRFQTFNYAEAVYRHFWKHFPGLRDRFRDWVVECGRALPSVDGDDVIVERYLDVCLKVNRSADVLTAVEAWTSWAPPRAALALSALERGLIDSREGWRFRRRCYEWSINSGLPVPLAQVVIAACVDVIAPNYPQQALVRLHHLSRHHDEEVGTIAQSELLRLGSDRQILRRLLARLVNPKRSNLHESHDRGLFLAVADPERLLTRSSSGRPLLAEVGVRSALVRGWAVVLSHGTKAEYEGYVRQWFEVATGRQVDDGLDVLVEACRADFGALATLASAAYRWLEDTGGLEAEARRRTVRGLLRAIDDSLETVASEDDWFGEGQS
ncbi:hypothetical protein [Pseudonocardia alaniniphila]|uniref:Uncharacterized protein n=1 Tax=Pseudonocardia alaniniphila TaxID=75291 RepID=A0ABS9T9E5_9PSEU|nr:hypothetical protein [Pseudonocardia alaniniphila]MCH6165152.1 hypothetical protein [Pseudonocardia alaniniphila]